MGEWLTDVLGQRGFLPHGCCFTWSPGVLWSTVDAAHPRLRARGETRARTARKAAARGTASEREGFSGATERRAKRRPI